MLAQLFNLRGTFLLVELKALTKAGDVEGFSSAMRKWEAVRSPGWPRVSLEEFVLWEGDVIPGKKVMLLHRVLITAAESGQVDIAEILIKRYGCITCTPAVFAAFKREQWGILKLFIKHGWNINSAVGGSNMYPVLKFVIKSEAKSRWCLDHGADPTLRTAALDHSVASVSGGLAPLSVVKLFREYGIDYTKTDALHEAAWWGSRRPGRVEVMAYLIYEVGYPINQVEHDYLPDVRRMYALNGLGTALHKAVKGECKETLKFLLENGADRGIADMCGNKPIDIAKEMGFKAGIRLLEQ
ncbi:Ankyrin repeat-containing protein [Glarea lozoyensis ATCC 20868]|uniref:Ankyrin repeat-containing protein n=2 Tax=Glarea lozoyensis TaxID=101852 RepID=S3DVA2_GLAL2|nr:Ankyrin repeat-containing protein [Glarea lozoyensis ATCC 20868]EHK99739.1 putative ankyrin repeat protein [Glarea lozoyensis 74030]EPE35861.1 Ankyrin repeat-containing protein [Glarea lozoyensis ATCC 20868]